MLNPQFGSGVLYGIPNAGNLAPTPTPMQFGILQEVSVEFKADLKKLFGQSQFPLAKARGKINVTAKGKMGSLDPLFFSQLYFGIATTAGVNRPVYNEQHAIAASVSPTELTATEDLGVLNATTGQPMINCGSGTPSAGQYKFTPGPSAAYTFNSTDVTSGFPVLLNYVWPDSTHGDTLSITNQLMGYAPEFQAILYNNFRGSLFALQLNSCVMGSVSIPTKQEDFWIADFDLEATADVSGNIGSIYSDQL